MLTILPLLTSLSLPAAHAASSYDALQLSVKAASGALQVEADDHAADLMEAKIEAKNEFFPDTGAAVKLPPDPGLAAGVVSFRIAGVPYLLKDVPLQAWFAPYVRDMAEQGIVSGYKDAGGIPTGVFGPERSVSVEELAKMAIEAARIDKSGCTGAPKNPLAQKSWSALYIACAEQHSFAIYGDGTTDIRRPASRAEVVMTILQAFAVPMQELAAGKPLFSDVSAATLFSAAINTAVQDGIVSGYTDAKGNLTGTFGPEKPINRAEVSKMLSIGVQKYRAK